MESNHTKPQPAETEGFWFFVMILFGSLPSSFFGRRNLLVEGLGVGGGGRNVGVTGSLVGAGGELELVGRLK